MNNLWSLLKKMTKDDGEGLRVIRKDDVWWKIQWFKGIHPKRPVKDPQVLCSLLDLKEWLYVTEINMVENELDYKNVFFWFRAVHILRHLFWTTKQQPLSNFNKEIRALWNFTKVHLQLYWPHTDWPHGALGILLWQGAGKQLTLAAA